MEPTKEQIEQKAKEMCNNSSLHRSFFEVYGRLLTEMAEWVLNYGKPKPFDITKCEIGTRVITRNGLTGRIICIDRVSDVHPEYTVIALIEMGGVEVVYSYNKTGNAMVGYSHDLFLI